LLKHKNLYSPFFLLITTLYFSIIRCRHFICISLILIWHFRRCLDNQQNDTQHNDTYNTDTQPNNTMHERILNKGEGSAQLTSMS